MVVLRPDGKPEAARISVLLEDRRGTLWCGTQAGLYAIDDAARPNPQLAEVPIGLPGLAWGDSDVTALAEDAEGGLWIGLADGTLSAACRTGASSAIPHPYRRRMAKSPISW